MHLLTDTARRLWRRIMRAGPEASPARRSRVFVLVSVLVVLGVVAGAVLVTLGGTPASTPTAQNRATENRATQNRATQTPAAGTSSGAVAGPGGRPAPSSKSAPVPVLGGNAASRDKQIPVSARAVSETDTKSASVAPLRTLRQADLLVVAPFTLSGQVLTTVSRQPGVISADALEAAKIKINGTFTAVLGVDPSTFRSYAAQSTAASNPLWQGVADGGVAVSYTMGTLDKLSLGGQVTALGRTQEKLPVVAFGTVGIGGVDAVVSDSTAKSLGMPASNAIVISAPPASLVSLAAKIKKVLPRGAAIEPLVTQVTSAGATPATGATSSGATSSGATSSGAGSAGASSVGGGSATGAGMTATELTTALRAAESARGKPYVWGAAGPTSFDCSGLVQWAFAQAGVAMPRVAADQARTGPAVPVSQLEPGDLLFYHTDPTDPGYISHVAIYLGNGWMIQAPQPGMNVEIVPASFGSEFAGAIRVSPQLAATLAAGPV
jgi:peptidoglycan DL-endopeptidase CwlO